MDKIKNSLNKLFGMALLSVAAILLCFSSLFWAGQSTFFVVAAKNSEYNGTIYAGERGTNKVCLMINVYWGTEELEKMLETLKKYDIKTTFFVGGTWAEKHAELLKSMADAGHEIGSHGYSHKEHGKLGFYENTREIERTHNIVKEILGVDMTLFAPPGGSYNRDTVSAAESLGYKTIMWTRDTIDWRDRDEKVILTRAVVDMQGGDLILMHPTAATYAALEDIILYAVSHDIALTTVSDVLGL